MELFLSEYFVPLFWIVLIALAGLAESWFSPRIFKRKKIWTLKITPRYQRLIFGCNDKECDPPKLYWLSKE